MKFIIALLVLVFSSSSSIATTLCATHDVIISHLEKRYKESPIAVGVADNGHLVEIFASEKGASWTLILTSPNGTSCLFAAGNNWQTFPFPIVDEKL